MTTQLPDRLRDLADDAPGSLSAAGLWQRGRRQHRRRVATAAVVAGLVVALTAGTGIGDWRSTQPSPAAPPATRSGPMRLPDRLYNPSRWAPTTTTPGRLVAVGSATRDHFPFGSDRNAVFGVAAGSQTYRFLDLPGQSSSASDAYLSPDGLHIAYWVGPERGGQRLNPGGRTGFAVLDLVTGRVVRHEVQTRFGLAVQSLAWETSDSLAMVADHFTSLKVDSWAGQTRTYLFTLGDASGYSELTPADVLDVPTTTWPQAACQPTCPSLYAETVGPHDLRVYHSDAHPRFTHIHLSAPVLSVAYQAAWGRVAATRGNPRNGDGPMPAPLVWGRVVHGRVRLRSVPGRVRYEEALTWVDPGHVTALRLTRSGEEYDVVDVRTGARHVLTSKPWYAFEVARDALAHPATVPGIAPPSPWNPRWVALGVLAALAAAGAVPLLMRTRRVRH